MAQYALRLPDSLMQQVKKVAAEDSISVNQFILSAVAEKTATIATENFFAERAGKGDVKNFLEVLSRVKDRSRVPGAMNCRSCLAALVGSRSLDDDLRQNRTPIANKMGGCYTVLHLSYHPARRNLMETTKLSSKGQVILPKHIRTAHKWRPGVQFVVEDTPEGILLRPLKPFKPTRLKDVIGCAGYTGPAKTIEEMEAAIAARIKATYDRD